MIPGVGIIGWGFMGRTHAASYLRAAKAGLCELRAVCGENLDPAARGNLDGIGTGVVLPPGLRVHTDPAAVLEDERIQVVSICTPTDTHVPLAEAALAAGKHVLVEKPVALRAEPIERLAAAAARADRLCMPAMCMRFWPGWPWLREHVRLGIFGEVRAVRFQRMGEPPAWGQDFYLDFRRSGGPLFDLHVHDVDFLLWCFGEPREVHASGSRWHVLTTYHFGGAPASALIEAAWVRVPGFGFRMRYEVIFEDAVAEFRHDARAPLLLTTGGRTRPVPLSRESAYDAQARHFLTAVRTGRTELRATLADAAAVTRVLEREAAQL